MAVPPACEGLSSYWEKYYYWPTGRRGEKMGHNKHHESYLREEVKALFMLYGVQVRGIVQGQVHVTKRFETPHKFIDAANEGDLDAPIEHWQKVCRSLLDYAVKHGYKETIHEQEESHSERR